MDVTFEVECDQTSAIEFLTTPNNWVSIIPGQSSIHIYNETYFKVVPGEIHVHDIKIDKENDSNQLSYQVSTGTKENPTTTFNVRYTFKPLDNHRSSIQRVVTDFVQHQSWIPRYPVVMIALRLENSNIQSMIKDLK
ncbi:hypothetical protein HDV02_005699, partial [Globomyces sp. JEL0801]